MVFTDAMFTLVGHVCASAALAMVAALMAVWFRRWLEGAGDVAADAADG